MSDLQVAADLLELGVQLVKKSDPEGEAFKSSPCTLQSVEEEESVILLNQSTLEMVGKSAETIQNEVKKKWDEVLEEQQLCERERDHIEQSMLIRDELNREEKIIDSLMKNFLCRHDQFQDASESYSSYLKNMVTLFDRWFDDLLKQMKGRWDETITEYETFQQEMIVQHETFMQILSHETNEAKLVQDNISNEEIYSHEETIQELKVKQQAQVRDLQVQLETKKMELEEHVQEVEKKCKQVLEVKKDEYDAVRCEHVILDNNINGMRRKLDRIQAAINHWNDKVTLDNSSHASKAHALATSKKDAFVKVKDMKQTIYRTQKQERNHLIKLATDARKAKAYLQSRLNRAQRILKRLEFIRELEKTEEAVAFYFPSNVNDDTTMSIEQPKATVSAESPKISQLNREQGNDKVNDESWSHMTKFWKKHNKVVSEIITMRHEHERLREERRRLMVCFRTLFNVHFARFFFFFRIFYLHSYIFRIR